jgi:tRNA pseudouridine65 synthase
LVEIRLETGRFHQARRHLHHLTHPIVGDKRHGDKAQNRFFAERYGVEHLFLRAHRLHFRHPWQRTDMQAVAGVPELWRNVAEDIGLELPARFAQEEVVTL